MLYHLCVTPSPLDPNYDNSLFHNSVIRSNVVYCLFIIYHNFPIIWKYNLTDEKISNSLCEKLKIG